MRVRGYPQSSWLDPGIEVKPSPIEGRGLFARRAFRAGEVVFVLGGTLIDDVQLAERQPRSSLAVGEGLHLMQSDDDPVRFGNHSCDPNCWMADEVAVVTRRPVAVGAELTQDYAVMTVSPAWRMVCRCGSASCRRVVTGEDWRLPALQARYRSHFSPFINQRIGASAG
jgi:SET domain-containing protein